MSARNGSKCSYRNCSNCSAINKHLSFFRFPVKNDERCIQWIVNSGNDDFAELSEKQLRSRYICAEHFEDSAFTNSFRNRLLHNNPLAIPKYFFKNDSSLSDTGSSISGSIPQATSCTKEKEKETFEQFCQDFGPLPDTDIINSKDKTDLKNSPTPRKKKLMGVITWQRTQLKRKNNTISFIKKRSKCKPNINLQTILSPMPNFVTGEPLTFIKMQLNHQQRSKWNEDEKKLSLSIYYKSPSAYRFLRERGFKLPCISLIQKWVNVHNISPGFNNEVFEKVKMKATTMSQEERECVLMCDEMSLRKALEYNPKLDLVEGFQDLGPLGRSEEITTHALVFMLRGLKNSWKVPIAFVVSCNSVKSSSLAILFDICIEKIFDAKLDLKAIVSDQGSTNAAALRLLGVTKETPYLFYRNQKIYGLYDFPHLLKSIRNNLLKHDFAIGNDVISWGAIKEFYELDKRSATDCRAAPKLSERHLNPQAFQKMSVKIATQVFSASVSRGMKAANSLGLLKHPASVSTANFVGKINDLTDCMNSKNLNEKNPLKKPMSHTNTETKMCLEESINFINSWTIKGNPKPPCFDGTAQTIQGVLDLYRDVVKEKGSFLLTSRLNQDPIENLFGVLRRRSGYNGNPSVKEFRRNIQHSLSIRLMKPPESANCEPDGDEMLPIEANIPQISTSDDMSCLTVIDSSSSGTNLHTQEKEESVVEPIVHTTDINNCILPLEDNVICYVAGWLGKKCIEKYSCDKCSTCLLNNENTVTLSREHLLYFKAFTRHTGELAELSRPTDKFHHVVQIQMLTFAKYFPTMWSDCGITSKLTQCMIVEVENVYSDWWNSAECKSHRRFMLDLLVKCKLYYSFKWKTHDIRDKALLKSVAKKRENDNGTKVNHKLRKLKHV